MKTKITLLIFLAVLVFGCSNNDDSASVPTLAGEWKLVNVRGGLIGVNETFPVGLIKWHVDLANNTVTVENYNTNPDMQDILESGTYTFSLQPDPNSICTQTFNVNNMDLGCYTVTDTELEVTYEYADGFTLFFVR